MRLTAWHHLYRANLTNAYTKKNIQTTSSIKMTPINNGGHARWKILATALRTTVKSDGDNEPDMHAVVFQSFDELVVGFGVSVVEGGIWHLGIERTDEFVARAEPLPASRAHANDIVRPFLADLANRVQPVLRAVALDPNLMSTFTPNRRKLHGIGGAMLFVMDEVLLGGG